MNQFLASCTISPMIDKELLEILVCPECKVSVVPKGDAALKCPRCRRVFPIQDNIPIMLLDEATVDSE
jgi:uncharacterized protein YbaR (Trm112 family)